MITKKILYIDYLKLIGLLCIILAHVCKNQYIMRLRNFDVTLLIIISGFLAIDSYERLLKNNKPIFEYYKKRILRLLIPTWTFLIIYFIIIRIVCINDVYPYSINNIIRSFLLLDGIGYVWIIRVYLICSFLTPLFYYLNNKIKNSKIKIFFLLIVYIIYELFVYYKINTLNIIFEYYIAYLIPYGIVYIFGMISRKKERKKDIIISITFFFVHILTAIILYFKNNNVIQLTQAMKYPPRIYYLSYGIFVSFLLFFVLKKINLKKFKIIDFCSKSSLWIYLWHIMIIFLLNTYYNSLNWKIKYIILLIGAISLTFIQNKIIDLLENTKASKKVLQVFRG